MVAALASGFIFRTVTAQTIDRSSSGQNDSLKRFLQDALRDPRSGEDTTTRYSFSVVDLKDDGTQEVIVHVTGQSWCGSGGCTTLVLAPDRDSYKVVTKIAITRPPIRVLATKTNGWHDLSVWVRGDGIQPGYEAELPFDGKSYPTNPSTPPARRQVEKIGGEVVVPLKVEGKSLYE
jgi:hypothetical protein